MTIRHLVPSLFLALVGAAHLQAEAPPKLLQTPALSATQIAFAYGGDIWVVDRAGGDAHRLITASGVSSAPKFSPDGTMVAYTCRLDGNQDVYVVPAAGGMPTRLTYHPGRDTALGWSSDGQRVLFSSDRSTARDLTHLFSVGLKGGLPTELPLPSGAEASYSPDDTHLAYVPHGQWEPDWKMYRGGQTTPIWIADLSDSSIVKVPRDNSNDHYPMWVGNSVYFLSDREGRWTLFEYDTRTLKVRKLVKNDGFDIQSAAAGPGGIVYSQFGVIHLYDLKSGKDTAVPIHLSADLPILRPRFEKIKPEQIKASAISPTGKRALFEAYGDIYSVPAEKGAVRNLTHSPGVEDRDPSWSPDGKWIAYFSDEGGEYALHLEAQDGLTPARKIGLGTPGSFFYNPRWSPDSTKIAYSDKRQKLYYVAIDGGAPVTVDTDANAVWQGNFDAAWSPDSQWLAYTKQLLNNFNAVYIYSLADKGIHQLTDGMADAGLARFDRNGKYLYFVASTERAQSGSWIDLTKMEAGPAASSVYAAVLRKDLPSPVAPQSDDEEIAKPADAAEAAKDTSKSPGATLTPTPTGAKPADKLAADAAKPADAKSDAKKDGDKDKVTPVKIDFDGLDQRIVSMPLAAGNYADLQTGKEGVIYTIIAPIFPDPDGDGTTPLTVAKYDLKTRKTDAIVSGVDSFALSANGEKMLIEKDKKWAIQDADKASEGGKGGIAADHLEAYVDPLASYRQMYHEVWRIERDFFYDPGYHGLDIAAAEKLYEPYLAGLGSRSDLTFLFREMTGWFVVGHMFVGRGEEPHSEKVSVGLLGADYAIANGHYQIAKIYQGENWNPHLQAPLTQPGIKLKQGDYIFAVNGVTLRPDDEIYRLFQETAGKQTVIRVGSKPDQSDAHDETVVPSDSEGDLRYRDWIDGNRRKVDQLSGGKLAYIHLPDTAEGGFTNFNRYYYAGVDKKGAILDERFNHGGLVADYIVDGLNRPIRMLVARRDYADRTEPDEVIQGPKVMIINEESGSGGDAQPWIFRTGRMGTLVGTQTWGGLVGIGGYPDLMDGGTIEAPRAAIYGIKGEWEIENHGVAPDIEVEMDPKLVREGHDPQLEKAVEVALAQLAKNPPPTFARPPYPNYHQKLPAPQVSP